MPTRAERRAFWCEHVERQSHSGLSAKAYAEQHGLAVANLYAARKPLGAAATRSWSRQSAQRSLETSTAAPTSLPPRFARVVATPSGRIGCRLRLTNGIVVELDCAADTLGATLKAASSLA